ncbi:hypothetical protein DY000_02024210 [Brassica cretica]|uniref:Ribosomal RNA adenine methylase transferase N-terminal domain-containing protein n=1 Tax=Brassica cretica TaxID=69181 RepID=A0ABQ7EHA0_BRACR|nr:hypothetical protein DY000_02024210 [Brassica cretica]
MSPVATRAKLHVAMVVFQTGYAGNHVIMRFALNLGVSKLVFPLYRTIIALSVLAPSAYFLEKKERPAMNTSLLIQFFLLGLVGITLNQGFYIFGLDNTSPTFASATENAVPAVSFLMAALLGIEKVELKRRDGIAKVVGTFVSVAGSLVITLYKGPTIYEPSQRIMDQSIVNGGSEGEEENKNWTLGCLCLMGHCLCWSSWIVLQSPLLKKYPARFSFISCSCFFAVIQFFGISAYFERDVESWKILSGGEVYALLYTGLVGSAMVFAIQIYVVERGGPLFVSAYLPLQTLVAAVLATFALGEHFYLGGMIGAILIISGLYLVVMGKSWESQALIIIQKDVLKTDFPEFDLVVANIPYNISSPLVAKLVYGSNTFRTATLLLQKEFSRRLLANPGDSDFNRLAVNVKLLADVKFVMDVSKREFVPPPKVDSSVVMITPKEVKPDVDVREWLAFTRTCFGKKNKTLGSMFRQKKKVMELLSLSEVGITTNASDVVEEEGDNRVLCLDTDASVFKERVIGILKSNGFEDKRPSKLSHGELLRLLSLFNQAAIFFHSLPMDLHDY